MRNGDYPDPTEVFHKLSVTWNDGYAAYHYKLTTLHEYENGERRIYNTETGDEDWAKRIADHYKIEVPEVDA